MIRNPWSNSLITRGRAATTLAAVVLAACSSSVRTSSTADTAAADTTTSTVAATTPPTAATTVPDTTPAPIVLTLRGDGIGPFDFGGDPDALIAEMNFQFGAPISDESREYPIDDGFGGFTTAEGDWGFTAASGREMCWSVDFCAEFAGADPASHSFAGWTYYSSTGLLSTSGVTIGSLWSEFPSMNVATSGCYTSGYGDIDGINLGLQSSGETFGAYDDAGNYIAVMPLPEQVTVNYMTAGTIPYAFEGDC
ncbi:MAG: hypothetical protein HY826_11485 [Actinobacteria bacterium]|nr:hypothetical protein [Actinomycetota bacterium]